MNTNPETMGIIVTLCTLVVSVIILAKLTRMSLLKSNGGPLGFYEKCKLVAIAFTSITIAAYVTHALGYPVPILSRGGVSAPILYEHKEYMNFMKYAVSVSALFWVITAILWATKPKD